MLGYEHQGKIVVGSVEVNDKGIEWLKSKFRGPAGQTVSYMLIDGSSVGLGILLELYCKPTPYKVVGERVALRQTPAISAEALGQYGKGKTVYGVPSDEPGWIRGETIDGIEAYMLIDGASVGLGPLLEKETVIDPHDDGVEATPVQAKLAEAAVALVDALTTVPVELEIETRSKVRLLMSIEVLGATLHTVMDMDFTGRTRTIEDGMRTAKACIKMAKEAGDVEAEAMSTDLTAVAYLMKGQAEYALKVAKEAQNLCRKTGDKLGEARTLTTMANCTCAKASRVMGGKRAESMTNIHPDKVAEFKRQQEEQLEDAARFAEDALFLVKDKNKRLEVKAMLKTAVIDLSAGKAEKAKDTCDEASAMAKKNKMPDLVADCLHHCIDCADVHMKRGEWSDAADVASEIGAVFKAAGNRARADEMIRMQINAHVQGQEGQWALGAAKNDLVRVWKGIDKTQEALAHHEVAKIYLAFREPENVIKSSREALSVLGQGEVLVRVAILRTMMLCHLVDEDKKDLKEAEKVAQECVALGQSSGNKRVIAYAKLWTGRCQAETFFENYIPKITLWKQPGFSGKRDESSLKVKDYEKAMKAVDEAYLTFEDLEDEDGMQEAFETAYQIQQKTNSVQEPAKTTHIFKSKGDKHPEYERTEYSYDYASVRRETEEKDRNNQAALVE